MTPAPGDGEALADLHRRVAGLERRCRRLLAVLRVLFALVRTPDLSRLRVAEPDKVRLLRAVERTRGVLGLRRVLALLGLSPSRLSAWRRAALACELADEPSCPGSSPHRLTPAEASAMAPPRPRARLASSSAPRPPRAARPAVRALRPDEIWHIDTTLVRLLDGTKAYLHAVIDNFSRRILAWRVAETFDPADELAVLVEAGRRVVGAAAPTTLLADQGVENVNADVDALVASGLLRRVLAQTEVRFSNSMIEAWWRSLKHGWLFLHPLDSVAKVRRLVEFYVTEHNSRLPHSAFRGQTPHEMYLGTGDGVPDRLAAARAEARRARLEANRAQTCAVCA